MNGCPTPEKLAYETRKQAKAAARRVRSKHGARGRIHAYRCRCGLFHLGTMPAWMVDEGRPR